MRNEMRRNLSVYTRELGLRHALPAALLAASVAAGGFAQQERGGVRQSFAYSTTDGEGRSIELRIEDGRVLSARVDGKDIPADRVRKVRGGYELLAEDGSVIRHVAVQQAGSDGAAEARGVQEQRVEVEVREPRVRTRVRAGGGGIARELVLGEARGPGMQWTEQSPPKSMIGAGLGSPDEALAHHLGIDRMKSTLVTSVVDGLPAAASGIERFDVIVAINGDADASADALRGALRDAEPGSRIVLDVVRGADRRKVEITAAAFDASRLEPLTVEGVPLIVEGIEDMIDFDIDGEDGERMMFFIGPDGRRREMRAPGAGQGRWMDIPALPGGPGAVAPDRLESFERMMEEMNRRMEDFARRLDERMRERGVERGIDRDMPREQPAPRAGDERMRQLEERIEQLRRELERERSRLPRGRDGDA